GFELAREELDRPPDVLLALLALFIQHAGDALVELGLEEAERHVLELPLQLEYAEPVREWRIDVEALARVARTFRMGIAREPAQRLRAARQAYQHHAHVLDHAEDHLAQRLVLLVGIRARRDTQL